MVSTSQAEWLNSNTLRAYPFVENSTRVPSSSSGGLMPESYAIPNYVFADALLTLPYTTAFPSLFVSSLTLAGGVVTAVISAYDQSSADASGNTLVGSVSVSTGSPVYTVAKFSGTGAYDGAVGAIVFGDLERFASEFPDGVFLFDRSQTTLEARCVRPSARTVSGIVAQDSADSTISRTLTGVVSLMAGSNVRLSYVKEANAIRIDVDANAGYNETCDCDGSKSKIRFINGVSASSVKIEGGDCISVSTKQGRITISDTCAKPCCGCEELNYLNLKSNELSTAVTKLESFSEVLSSRMTEFKENFLQSERAPYTMV